MWCIILLDRHIYYILFRNNYFFSIYISAIVLDLWKYVNQFVKKIKQNDSEFEVEVVERYQSLIAL